jgi:hypothetical protein
MHAPSDARPDCRGGNRARIDQRRGRLAGADFPDTLQRKSATETRSQWTGSREPSSGSCVRLSISPASGAIKASAPKPVISLRLSTVGSPKGSTRRCCKRRRHCWSSSPHERGPQVAGLQPGSREKTLQTHQPPPGRTCTPGGQLYGGTVTPVPRLLDAAVAPWNR